MKPASSLATLDNSHEVTDERAARKAAMILAAESSIDPNRSIYLITWSPDPKQLPNADFRVQHSVNIDLLRVYLKACYSGIICVESTQLGNPHYHGWYQTCGCTEQWRIVAVKTMQRFGLVKIDKIKRSYRINSYTQKNNALYYYKKDMLDDMLFIDLNPITSDTHVDIDFSKLNIISFLDTRYDKKQSKSAIEVLNDQMTYLEFYKDTLANI